LINIAVGFNRQIKRNIKSFWALVYPPLAGPIKNIINPRFQSWVWQRKASITTTVSKVYKINFNTWKKTNNINQLRLHCKN